MTPGRPVVIRRSARARQDILEIWLYVAESNPIAADRILDDIERVCTLLSRTTLRWVENDRRSSPAFAASRSLPG
jgi:plasmid stabilization system protein ParE